MWSGSKAGSYLRLMDFVYPSTLGLRVTKKKKRRGEGDQVGRVVRDVERSCRRSVDVLRHLQHTNMLTTQQWEGYHESRRCSRDTYPESYITKWVGNKTSSSPVSTFHKVMEPSALVVTTTSSCVARSPIASTAPA